MVVDHGSANSSGAHNCRKGPTGAGLGASVEPIVRELALRGVGHRARLGGQIGRIEKREYGRILTYFDVRSSPIALQTVATNWLHFCAESAVGKIGGARVAQQEAPASRDGG